uniref:Crossover junction endodeoxyribonuclease RuvC n=1 Tax=Desulfobacca acetoxidans TaxID=60893 RepID=A0A7C3Z9T8_9BACT
MIQVVMGVDPGSRHTGFGVIRGNGNRLDHLAHGQIAPKGRAPLELRLRQIYDALTALLQEHQPQSLALEDMCLAMNVQTAFILGQVRGVVLLAAAQAGVPIHVYPPLTVKKAVVGYGQATKAQVKMMVENLLGLTVAGHHAADALAVGVCHYFHSRRGPAL